MRNQLLTGVAIAALSLSVAGAMAQERNPAAGSAPGASSSERGGGAAKGSEGAGQERSAQGQGQSKGEERSAQGQSRSEERSQQGQRASEGAGRDGATRNASERGQERSAAGRDNNEDKGASATRSGASEGQRGASSTAGGREDSKDQKSSPSSAQTNERGGQQSPSTAQQRSGADQDRKDTTTRSTATGDDKSKDRAPSASASGERDRKDQQPSSASSTTERERSTTQSTTTQQGGAQTGQSTSRDAATTRSGSDTARSTTSAESSANVQVRGELNVDRQAATRVHERLIRDTSVRETNINIDIDVGRNLPDRVRLRPVPPEIVEISPRYRNYEYTIVRDEIVIVEPKTRKVVQVISGGSRGGKATSVRLDTRQRDLVKRDVLKTRTGSAKRQDLNIELREGVHLPDRVTLMTFPEEVWREVPELREVRYIIIEDDVILVDPDSREVIEIIR